MELEELVERDMADGGQEPAPAGTGWDEVGATLQGMVGKDAFQRWFGSARWLGVDDDAATIAVPGEIHQVWIETNYLPELTMAVTGSFDEVREVRVIVGKELEAAGAAEAGAGKKEGHESRPTRAAGAARARISTGASRVTSSATTCARAHPAARSRISTSSNATRSRR